MSILCDYHMHSSFSFDSETPMEQQVQSAMHKGLEEICFTEHVDLDWPYENSPAKDSIPYTIDFDAYRREFLRMQSLYGMQIGLHFGVEIGLSLYAMDKSVQYLMDHPAFEFVIGSVHSSGRRDPFWPDYYTGRSVQEACLEYFQNALLCLRKFHTGFDTYGHLDYILRYADQNADLEKRTEQNLTYNDYFDMQNQDLIDQILAVLIENGVALELNTSALGKGRDEPNPGRFVLRRYKELGGDYVTVGSDAHRPDAVAAGFDKAAEILSDAGFSYYFTFQDHKPLAHRL